jgi:phosphoribosylanthranilate isomerase
MSAAPARVRVKICGVTNRADAEAAIALGADALGFNLFPGSKRCLDLEREAEWIAALPPFVTRVAVLVNVPIEEARRVAEHPAIDCVQFHGDEDETFCAEFARLGRPFIKALRLGDSPRAACCSMRTLAQPTAARARSSISRSRRSAHGGIRSSRSFSPAA